MCKRRLLDILRRKMRQTEHIAKNILAYSLTKGTLAYKDTSEYYICDASPTPMMGYDMLYLY
jgi:hypothetical protein